MDEIIFEKENDNIDNAIGISYEELKKKKINSKIKIPINTNDGIYYKEMKIIYKDIYGIGILYEKNFIYVLENENESEIKIINEKLPLNYFTIQYLDNEISFTSKKIYIDEIKDKKKGTIFRLGKENNDKMDYYEAYVKIEYIDKNGVLLRFIFMDKTEKEIKTDQYLQYSIFE